MTPNEQTINLFQTRVRQLILRYQQLKRENDELYAMVDRCEREKDEARKLLEEKCREYDSLKTARMLKVSDGDINASKERLSKLIRDVNKCIAVLSDQKAE